MNSVVFGLIGAALAGLALSATAQSNPAPLPPAQNIGQMRLAEPVQIQPSSFEIQVSDANLRSVIQRWARDAGWVFEAQHWTLPRDIPLAGRATFDGPDFRMAVRWLMRSTLQTDLPSQACFYSNQVVRVISLQENCVRNLSQE